MNLISNNIVNKNHNMEKNLSDNNSILSCNESMSSVDGNMSDNVVQTTDMQVFHTQNNQSQPLIVNGFVNNQNLRINNFTAFPQYHTQNMSSGSTYLNLQYPYSTVIPQTLQIVNQLPNTFVYNQMPNQMYLASQANLTSQQPNKINTPGTTPFFQSPTSNSNLNVTNNNNQSSCDTGVPISGCVPSNYSSFVFPSNCCFFVGYNDGTVSPMQPDFVYDPQQHGVYEFTSNLQLVSREIIPRTTVNPVKSSPIVVESYPKKSNSPHDLSVTRSRNSKQIQISSNADLSYRNTSLNETSHGQIIPTVDSKLQRHSADVGHQKPPTRRFGFRSKQIKIDRTHSSVLRTFKDVLAKPDELVRGDDTVRVHVKKFRCLTVVEDALADITNDPELNVVKLAAPISKKNAKQKKGFIIYLKIDDASKINKVVTIFKSYGLDECVVAPERKTVVQEVDNNLREDSYVHSQPFESKNCSMVTDEDQEKRENGFVNKEPFGITLTDTELTVSLTPPCEIRRLSCGG